MRFTIFQDSLVGDRSGNEDRVGYSYGKDVLLIDARSHRTQGQNREEARARLAEFIRELRAMTKEQTAWQSRRQRY